MSDEQMGENPQFHEPELSHVIEVDALPNKGVRVRIEADDSIRAQLAERFDLLELNKLSAFLEAKPLAGGKSFMVKGRLEADYAQACVMSLEPVGRVVDEEFEVEFGPDIEMQTEDDEMDLAENDPPEPIIDGKIDLGEVVAQQLGLSMDPYPRKEGAELAAVHGNLSTKARDAFEVNEASGPFAKLAQLKKK